MSLTTALVALPLARCRPVEQLSVRNTDFSNVVPKLSLTRPVVLQGKWIPHSHNIPPRKGGRALAGSRDDVTDDC